MYWVFMSRNLIKFDYFDALGLGPNMGISVK